MPRAKLIVPEAAQPSVPVEVSLAGVPTRLASRLFASTVGMLVLIPGLMLLAGAGLVWMGQSGLRSSIEAGLRQRVGDLTANAARATTTAFDQAGPLLGALRDHVLDHRKADPREFATAMRLLMRFRPGLRYLSFSDTDGVFLGVYTDNGVLRLNQSWIESDGTTTRRISDIADDGSLTTAETTHDTGYDPRTRPFYAPAVAAKGPTWTAPYQFYQADLGVTCAQAVRDPENATLLGVATADFDFSSLGALMVHLARQGPKGGEVFLFAGDKQVLAASGDRSDRSQKDIRAEAIAAVGNRLPATDELLFTDLSGPGHLPYLLGVRGIGMSGGPLWYAGTRVPRDAIAAEADAQFLRALWVGVAGLTVSVTLAALLANYLARQRRMVSSARAAEHSAQEKLQAMGSYTLVRELGKGGMGAVWMAQHQLLARPAALKLILPEAFGNGSEEERAEARERFAREAKATASLRSRNTVTLYDYGTAADGSFYYAMELLDGLDLDRLVTAHGPQLPGRVIAILIQACNSLAEAHARGMVHRDIKPANLYLCRLGLEVDVVKVLDFGLVAQRSKGIAQLTESGIVQGTPAFMAPEQAQAHAIDGRADLYAIGCVAYWLLTGHLVFDKASGMATMIEHVNTPPEPLTSLTRQPIAAGLQALVMDLLAKDPAKRPANAGETIARLRAIQVPEGQGWTHADADSWWTKHSPPMEDGVADPVQVERRRSAATVVGQRF